MEAETPNAAFNLVSPQAFCCGRHVQTHTPRPCDEDNYDVGEDACAYLLPACVLSCEPRRLSRPPSSRKPPRSISPLPARKIVRPTVEFQEDQEIFAEQVITCKGLVRSSIPEAEDAVFNFASITDPLSEEGKTPSKTSHEDLRSDLLVIPNMEGQMQMNMRASLASLASRSTFTVKAREKDRRSERKSFIGSDALERVERAFNSNRDRAVNKLLTFVNGNHYLPRVTVNGVMLWVSRLLCAYIFLFTALIFLVVFFGNHLADEFMAALEKPMRGQPGYLADFLSGTCWYLRRTFGDKLLDIEAFNSKLRWQSLVFKSRADRRDTKALYFPSYTPRTSPRVVLAHGVGTNFLDDTVQTAAYFLRLMNISVLVPNLRHHCCGVDGDGSRWRMWHKQFLDVLGAWDYAVSDPNGELGGSLLPSKVGLMGFDFGGLAVQNAFAREPRVESMLLDGAVFDARELFIEYLSGKVSSTFAWLFQQQAWSRCKARANYDLDRDDLLPGELAARTTKGKVAIVHSLDDTVVGDKQRGMLLDSLNRHSSTITVVRKWYPSLTLDMNCKNKREVHLAYPDKYLSFLCAFWWSVFDNSAAHNGTAARATPPTLCANFVAPPGD